MRKRVKTKYPGVTCRLQVKAGWVEKVYYIRYRLGGRGSREIEEPVYPVPGRTISAKVAADIRADRMRGREPSNALQRAALKEVAAGGRRASLAYIWREYKRQRPGLKGLAADESRFKTHLTALAGLTPDEMTTDDLDRLKADLTRDGKAPQTVKNVLGLLHRLVNFAARKGWCAQPEPSRLAFEFPKVNNIKTEYLRREEIERLLQTLDEASNQKAANMMRLALYTGMRRGELFRLKWADIDWERGFITLTGEMVNGHDTGPKSGSNKKIPLNAAAADVLRRVQGAPDASKESPYVFPGRDGKSRLSNISLEVRKIAREAGLPDGFRPLHGLRHTFASTLASSGEVDLYTLQKLLTHGSSQMTQRYAHLHDDTLRKAATLACDLFKRQTES